MSALDRLDVDGLRPLVAGLGVKGHLRALGKRLEAVAADAAVMDEEILATIVRSDEAEALVVVEPLDGAAWHVLPPSHVLRTRRRWRATTASAGTALPTLTAGQSTPDATTAATHRAISPLARARPRRAHRRRRGRS